jgi:general secretion pathway protein E
MTIQDISQSVMPQLDSFEAHVRLGELLVQSGKLTARDLDRALAAQQELGSLLGRVLVSLGLVSESDVLSALSRQLSVPLLLGDGFPELMPEVPGLLPEFLHANNVFPLKVEADALHVAMSVPQDAFVKKALQLATGLVVKPCIALESDIERALAGPVPDAQAEDEEQGLGELDSGDFVEHLKDLASEAPVIRLVNTIVSRVIDMRASDIHLEPFDDGLHVRYRTGSFTTLKSYRPATARQ